MSVAPRHNLPPASEPWGRYVSDSLEGVDFAFRRELLDANSVASQNKSRLDNLASVIRGTDAISQIVKYDVEPFTRYRNSTSGSSAVTLPSPKFYFTPPASATECLVLVSFSTSTDRTTDLARAQGALSKVNGGVPARYFTNATIWFNLPVFTASIIQKAKVNGPVEVQFALQIPDSGVAETFTFFDASICVAYISPGGIL